MTRRSGVGNGLPANIVLRALAAGALLLLGGCGNFGYYWQSVSGHVDVMGRQRPIAEVLEDPATPEQLRARLETVNRMRAFATRELALPDNHSYKRYADLERPYVVWNVMATPEFSLKPLHWCFAFAGCVSYRGYFDRQEAERFAAGLRAQGYDVVVGGVPAYSTLGWFADPVLNTVIHYSNPRLARLIFHELSHQIVYARGDTVFNESFATAVEKEGVRRWIARHGEAGDRASYERSTARRDGFIRLVVAYQGKLKALYGSRLAPEAMRARKRELFAEMQRDYQALKASWGGFSGYDRWFASGVNNAHLASISVYTRRVPAFEALLRREDGDLVRFYEAARQLAALPRRQRERELRALSQDGDKRLADSTAPH